MHRYMYVRNILVVVTFKKLVQQKKNVFVSHLAVEGRVLADVSAVEKLSIEQLYSNHSKDKLKRKGKNL